MEYVIVDILHGVKPVFGVRGFLVMNYEQLGKDRSNSSHTISYYKLKFIIESSR